MGALKRGVALPYVGARSAAELAQAAEQAGWDGVFMGDAIWCEDPMIALTAAAMVTHHIRLGTMITPAPLRKPWKLASETLALERLSGGRLTLGLGAGAVWMGWQAFPDERDETRIRAEMLDETIDILDGLYRRKPFDYEGKHFHVRLTHLDEQFYPPAPVQQPRIPLWVVGVWPRSRSMERALKCDGILPQKITAAGQIEAVTPEDVFAIRAFLDVHLPPGRAFDIVVEGRGEPESARAGEKLTAWQQAGATWWIDGLWSLGEGEALERIRLGPP